jgi:methyl-accepting chemotaxis protein
VRHKQLDAIERDFDGFMKVGRQMTEAYLQQGLEAGNALMKGDGGLPGFDQASEKIGEHLQALREDQVARSRQEAMALANSTRVMQWSMLGGAVLAALLGLALATATVRSVHSALGGDPRAAAAIVERVGAGELDVAIDRDKAHPGSLLARLDEMQRRLAALVAQVRQQSHDIEETSVAIARDGGDLSQRTASQVAALQQTASTMAQVDTGIRQGVQGVRQADTLAAEACDRATQGGETVSRFVETMAGIDEASRRIADIIGVIDGIAFQTNILALNAAVEAARAGEQGRGFAVVASEVRALAGRSAAAAREVKALIQTTAQRVEQGTLLVTEARDTMASVVRSIGEVSRAMAGVVESAGAQSIGVSEVAAAVTSMDGMTQANSALVERSATAAERLRQQSHALAEAMQAFRLGDGPPLAGAAAIG